jgi:hypothetical protein
LSLEFLTPIENRQPKKEPEAGRSKITCISNREKLADLPGNINHFQANLLKGFLDENLSASSTAVSQIAVEKSPRNRH